MYGESVPTSKLETREQFTDLPICLTKAYTWKVGTWKLDATVYGDSIVHVQSLFSLIHDWISVIAIYSIFSGSV